MNWDKKWKIKFYIKIHRKIQFLHFLWPQKSKNHDFSMVFHQKWVVTPPKITIFSFFIYIQAKNEKNYHFWRGLIFPIWVDLDPFFIKNVRFHALQQEKLLTKVIIISLSWTHNPREFSLSDSCSNFLSATCLFQCVCGASGCP